MLLDAMIFLLSPSTINCADIPGRSQIAEQKVDL